MEPGEVTGDDIIQASTAQFLSGPDDSIFDSVFDWVENAIEVIVDPIIDWINKAVDWIVEGVMNLWDTIIQGISSVVNWIKNAVTDLWDWVFTIGLQISNWIYDAWNTIYSAATSAISTVWDWLQDTAESIFDWVTDTAINLWEWITDTISNLWHDISSWFTSLWNNVSSAIANLAGDVWQWILSIPDMFSGFFDTLWEWIGGAFEGIKLWFTESIVGTLSSWWDWFIEKLYDFGAWVGGLLEAVWNWVSRDVPGSSPWWEGVLDTVLNFFAEVMMYSPFSMTAKAVEFLTPAIVETLRPIGEIFNTVFESFMEAFEGFVSVLGPTNPDIAGSASKSLTSVGMTAIAGLAGMTLASSWLKPLGGAGMGQIAAMIYDMTNFKIITGAGIAALTVAAIRTPMTYHYNQIFRPNLLSERDFMELHSRRAFTEPETLQNPDLDTAISSLPYGGGDRYVQDYIGYRGYPAEYIGIFRELANTPLRYFPLAGIARTGFYEETWFKEALARSGYSKTAKDALLVMYKKMVDEVLQGSMSGAAITRFKEGFTTEAQFRGEMTLLAYSDSQIDKYLVAAEMDYATDYIRDLIAAYRDAVRKGQIDIDTYRSRLLGLGIVPERVEGYVLREMARIKPGEELSAIGIPGEIYLSDTGKIQVDTIRRQRRKVLITRDQEIVALKSLGAPDDYAFALADNDDVRLAEKGTEE